MEVIEFGGDVVEIVDVVVVGVVLVVYEDFVVDIVVCGIVGGCWCCCVVGSGVFCVGWYYIVGVGKCGGSGEGGK